MGIVHAKVPEKKNEEAQKINLSGIKSSDKELKVQKWKLYQIQRKLSEIRAKVLQAKIAKVKAKVERVHIDGIGKTKEDIVIGSVRDVFSASDFQSVILRIHEARMRLENLGCFKNVGVLIDTYDEEGASNNGIEITFDVQEVNLLGGKLNTSVGNNEGCVTLGATLKNIFGRGEELTSESSYGTKKTSSFHTTFRKPFHNEAGTELTTSIYQQASESPWAGYKEIDRGLLIGLGFSPAAHVHQKLILDGAWRHLGCLSRSTTFAVREQCGHSLKSALRHELRLDKRDETIFPTEGILCTIKNELAGLGGNVGFFKNELDVQVNLPLIKNMVVQGTLQAGHLHSLPNKMPYSIMDKFLLGGATTIRGFEMGGIGPHSEGFALGAEMYWAAALHFFCPLPLLDQRRSFSDKFRLHAFVNMGNIGDFVLNYNYRRNFETLSHDMRLSYGAGLAMNLGGFARVELNYCIPLMLQKGDRPYNGLQFGVSTSFL